MQVMLSCCRFVALVDIYPPFDLDRPTRIGSSMDDQMITRSRSTSIGRRIRELLGKDVDRERVMLNDQLRAGRQ